jgi:hypothetical protein
MEIILQLEAPDVSSQKCAVNRPGGDDHKICIEAGIRVHQQRNVAHMRLVTYQTFRCGRIQTFRHGNNSD